MENIWTLLNDYLNYWILDIFFSQTLILAFPAGFLYVFEQLPKAVSAVALIVIQCSATQCAIG